jgi:hypothetical protein
LIFSSPSTEDIISETTMRRLGDAASTSTALGDVEDLQDYAQGLEETGDGLDEIKEVYPDSKLKDDNIETVPILSTRLI